MERSFSPDNLLPRVSADVAVASGQAERMLLALSRRADSIARAHGKRVRALVQGGEVRLTQLARRFPA